MSDISTMPSQLVARQPFSVSNTAPPIACERCHKYKERCIYELQHEACSRCKNLGRDCKPRQRKRPGRRPVLKGTPYGTSSVFSLETPNREDSRRPHAIVSHAHKAVGYRHSFECLDARQSTLAMQSHTALALNPFSLSLLESTITIPTPVHHMLHSHETFYTPHRHFVLGKSFVQDFHTAILLLFKRSPQLLGDAYHAVLELLVSQRQDRARQGRSSYLVVATNCLKRILDISLSATKQIEDVAVNLMLGQLLLVYNLLMICPSPHAITRATLITAKDWYPILIQQPILDTITITPVFVDTIECLIRRELPVLRLPESRRPIVDRLAGACSSLLPLLYDLCACSSEAKRGAQLDIGDGSQDDGDPYVDVEQRIGNWTPNLPSDFDLRYTTLERDSIQMQASLYRLSALLIIHRLRFPLGTQDEPARCLANEILNELGLLQRWPLKDAIGLGIDFPLLIAMLEIPTAGTDMFAAFEPIRIRPHQSQTLLNFAQLAQKARESGFKGLWFDLAESGLQGVFLP